MRGFPIFLDLSSSLPLVAGGSDLAVAKIRLLLGRAPVVSVATPQPTPEIIELFGRGRIELIRHRLGIDDIRGRSLVIAATGDDDEDARISAIARDHGAAVNVPDRPHLCTFTLAAIVDRDPVTIAIGTDGTAPVLATQLRASIERDLHPRIGRVAAIAQEYRVAVAAKVPAGAQRRAFWEDALSGAAADSILAGDEDEGRLVLDALLKGASSQSRSLPGRVLLVGAGPGDPELLTLKAVRALKSADVILHDHLVGDDVLDFARREALIIPVGKQCGRHSRTQSEINDLIVTHARAGRTVVRLKGGDPFVFGRAAEEMAAAEAAGIEVEIVPGITAAQGCAAAVGLPLTARGHVRQVSLVTGATTNGEPELDWPALAQPGQAFAIYMGVRTADEIAVRLLAAGADPETRAVIVENGTRANQRVIATTLVDLPAAVTAKGVHGPAILFVGLDWAGAGLARPSVVETYEPARLQSDPRLTAARATVPELRALLTTCRSIAPPRRLPL